MIQSWLARVAATLPPLTLVADLSRSPMRSLKFKVLIALSLLLLLSTISTIALYSFGTEETTRQLLLRQVAADMEAIPPRLAARANLLGSSAGLLANDPAVQKNLPNYGQDSLEEINRVAVVMRDRFELDLVQIYDPQGVPRTNLVTADLYRVSSVNELVQPGQVTVIDTGGRLLLVASQESNANGGVIIVGVDLARELARQLAVNRINAHLFLKRGNLAVSDSEQNLAVLLATPGAASTSKLISMGDTIMELHIVRLGELVYDVNRAGRNLMILGLILAGIVMLFLAERLANLITQPISRLADSSEALAQGNFDLPSAQLSLTAGWHNPLQIGQQDEIGRLAVNYDNMVDELRNLYSGLINNLQNTNQELIQAYDATLEGWARALDMRDQETGDHTRRVTELTMELARRLGVPEAGLPDLRRGATLHDIGKLGIPDTILLKPGRLSEEEWIIMRRHPLMAYQMLYPIKYLRPALDIPLYHHERWDGKGYPRNLKGAEIPLAARIFAVVDVWDALNSDRPYRPRWTPQRIVDLIRSESGTHFDPHVAECFLDWVQPLINPMIPVAEEGVQLDTA